MSAILLALLLVPASAASQDTLGLAALQQAAAERDPRARQMVLQDAATELRLANLDAEWLPALRIGSQASHQSEVPGLPLTGAGAGIPRLPKDHYEVTLELEQRLLDGGATRHRRAIEEARLRAEHARIAADLFPLRTEVNEAFFRGVLLQERLGELTILVEDLEARLALVRTQVREGAALPGDTAELRAELLRTTVSRQEVAAERRAALAVLAELTGRPVGEQDLLALPDLEAAVIRTRAAIEHGQPSPGAATTPAGSAAIRTHPRYALFAAQRSQIEREAALLRSRSRPQLSAFGQLGYGRPGLRMFTDEVHEYWLAGVRLSWQPWAWGTTAREGEILRIRREIVETEQTAFTEQLRRQVLDELEAMEHLQAALEIDDRIIVLREQVERQARAQLTERAITPSAYLDVRTDLLVARLARQRHRVELARARAQYLTTWGVSPW